MKFLKLLLCCITFNNFFITSAIASSDNNYCNFSLSLINKNNNICSNLPFLSPFNDSRTNLILLINNPSIQKNTFNTLLSPQNKTPYLANELRRNIAYIPFEFSVYNTYLDNLTNSQQLKIEHTKKTLNEKTKSLILQVMGNDSLITNEDFLNSPALEFIQQVATSQGLNDNERKDLFSARYILFDNPKAEIQSFIPKDPSFTARHFSNYLLGIDAFYKNNYSAALKYFNKGVTAAHPWIKEASTYMVARTLLNQGQHVAFNNWLELDLNKVDKESINQSLVAFKNYINKYPNGKYKDSATNLLRRLYWLQGNQKTLAASYEYLLENPQSYSSEPYYPFSVANLILEIDNKIYTNSFKANALSETPYLLAVYDLLKMRSNQLTKLELENQKESFEEYPELYNYLLATYYTYIEPDPKQVLKLIPELTIAEEANRINTIQFSSQILRAIALENSSKWFLAEKLWKSLNNLPLQSYQYSLIELGLALTYEKTNTIDKVFEANSLVTTPQLRYILLRKNANRLQLKKLASTSTINLSAFERASIIYLLLYKDLLSQKYTDFLKDSSLLTINSLDQVYLGNISRYGQTNLTLFSEPIPSHREYPCPSPIILANVLKLNANDARALNCLGEFSEHYKLPFSQYMLQTSLNNTNTGSLGTNNPTSFGHHLYSRLEGYQSVMNDENASEDDRAYAVYKAIRCFAGTGYNQCDKQYIPKAKRKEWFNTLHSQYAKTLWARQQPIYW